MDVPPMASQEVVQAENQPAVDALRRLAVTRDAFLRMLEAQPSLTETTASGAQQLLDALPRYWASPETPGGERRSAVLGRHLAALMKEEATLRGLDGTLRDDAMRLATRIAGAGDDPLAAGIHARELMLGEVAHAGSLIVFDDAHPGLALLFTAHGGWEAFDSLERLLESTRRRLLEAVDVTDGTGLDEDDFAEAKAQNSIGSRDIAGSIFTTLANRMIDVQARRVALVVDDFALDSDVPNAERELGDRVRDELSTAALFDIDAIEQLREARLVEANIAERLASVPADVRADWYKARDTYNDALAGTAMLRMAIDMRPPATLRTFASRELATRLAALGIEESPEAITVEIAPVRVLPEPLGFLDPLSGSMPTRRIPLIDLACQNVGRFSLEALHAIDASGNSMRDRIDHTTLRNMVRELDIGSRYQAHVDETLHGGVAGPLARKLAITVQAARMRMDAAEARLSYYLPGEPASFMQDRAERGFRWVEAALDSPDAGRSVEGHPIEVSQVTYQQTALENILIFASRAPQSAPRIVMYTPGAPDGVTFREFDDRQQAARRFLYHPAFREYLLDRLPAEFAKVLPNGASREFAGGKTLANWVLGSSSTESYTRTAEPFDERRVAGDFLAALHGAGVEKQRRDTQFLTRSTAEADKDALFNYLQGRFSIDPVGSVAANVLAEVPASFSRMMQASWRLYDHVKAGDTGEAVVAFADGYVNALNLVVPPLAGGRHVAAAIVRSRAATRGMASTSVRFMPPAARFEERYAVTRLRKPGKPDHEGIYRVGGQSYIEHDNTFFLVKLDTDYGLWRLAPPRGAVDARFTGPLIERVDSRWVYVQDAGLRGGMRRLRQQFNRFRVQDDAAPAAAAPEPAVAPVPEPAGQSPIELPAIMEPHRAEITAVMTDNPSARPMIRADGANLQFILRTRSAMIVDPHLHPEIAALSAHQRRVFLHELDTRFPLASERTEVLNVRGWAGPDGYGSTPPGSPTATSPGGVQSSVISTSTGETPASLPMLSASQQQRWDAALAVARQSARRSSTSSTGGAAIESLGATEIVPPAEWPDRIWYFSERDFEPRYLRRLLREGISLDAPPGWSGGGGSVRTYPVTTLPPEMPAARLSEALGMSPAQQPGQRDPLGHWVQIDLTHARAAQQVAPRTPPWWTGVEMHRRLLSSGEYQYTLQSRWHLGISTTDVAGVGRRGERGYRVQ